MESNSWVSCHKTGKTFITLEWERVKESPTKSVIPCDYEHAKDAPSWEVTSEASFCKRNKLHKNSPAFLLKSGTWQEFPIFDTSIQQILEVLIKAVRQEKKKHTQIGKEVKLSLFADFLHVENMKDSTQKKTFLELIYEFQQSSNTWNL